MAHNTATVLCYLQFSYMRLSTFGHMEILGYHEEKSFHCNEFAALA